jgi:hypothetical protein
MNRAGSKEKPRKSGQFWMEQQEGKKKRRPENWQPSLLDSL